MERSLTRLLLLPFLLFSTVLLFSQEESGFYTIVDTVYDVDGMTRDWAIENYLNMPDELVFEDYGAMNLFAEKMKQDLVNLRVFEEVHMFLIPRLSEENPDRFYDLKFILKDAWTFFPLLVPTFDTNDDITLQLKVSYANLLGTLVNFSIDGDFGIARNPATDNMEVNFWSIDTSFSNINVFGIAFTFSWIQAYDRIVKKDGTEVVEYYTFNESDFFIASNFDLGNDYYYEVTPAFELTYNYQDQTGQGTSYIDMEPQSYGLYQKVGRDQVDWKGNMRQGNNWEADFQSRMVSGSGYKGKMTLSNRWFTILSPRFSYSNRVLAFGALKEDIPALGEYMRGVPNFNLSGDSGIFVNNSMPFRLFNWTGVLETQLQPFIDMGIVNPVDRDFLPGKDMRMSIGSDIIFYPEKLTTINLRMTFGLDLFGPGPLSDRYEILFSTSLFY